MTETERITHEIYDRHAYPHANILGPGRNISYGPRRWNVLSTLAVIILVEMSIALGIMVWWNW